MLVGCGPISFALGGFGAREQGFSVSGVGVCADFAVKGERPVRVLRGFVDPIGLRPLRRPRPDSRPVTGRGR
jgi:hypothetical protein